MKFKFLQAARSNFWKAKNYSFNGDILEFLGYRERILMDYDE